MTLSLSRRCGKLSGFWFCLLLLAAWNSIALQIGENYSPSRPVVGGKLTYTFNLINNGTVAESDTVFTDQLPVTSVFVSATATNGNYSVAGNVLTYRPDTIEAGGQVVLQVVVTPVTGAMLTNECHWSSPMGGITWSASTTPVQTAIAGPKMVVGRNDHASTLLPDGRVLIAGGSFIVGISSAEVYDPAENAFALVGSMAVKRPSLTATLLTNGMVLVVGGGSDLLEQFDPAANSFVTKGKLEVARAAHTLTTLGNGDIIIAGGAGSSTLIERYRQVDGQWIVSQAGNLTVARSGHAAVLLASGEIVFAGGTGGSGTFAERYNPQTQISVPLSGPASPLPLVAAGSGKILFQAQPFEVPGGTELYDAEANTLVSLPAAPPKASGGNYFSLANGDFLITGGQTSGNFNFGVEIFNPRTGAFKAAPSLATTRSHHSVVQLADGRFLLTGGADLDGIMSGDCRSTEIYVLRMDFDSDGMDDDWELARGFDPARREDAVEDADGEGHSNLQEFLAGTDPRDPLNVLRIETPRKIGNNVQIRFPTVLGKYYRVERSPAPNAASWDVVAGNVAGDGHVAEILDPINSESPSSIYRVVLQP